MSDPKNDDEWLDARERGESVDHVDAATRARYRALEKHIAELPDDAPPDGWQARVLERLGERPSRRSSLPWVGAGVLAVAATIALVLAFRGGPHDRFDISVNDRADAYRGAEKLLVHDKVRVRAPSLADIRIYSSNGQVLARCPRGPHCVDSALELDLDVAGAFDLVGFDGCTPPEPASDLANDLVAAEQAGCTVTRHEPLRVR